MSTAMIDPHDEATCSLRSALKNLAKIHHLPPFVALYVQQQEARIVVHPRDAADWRQGLALPPFGDADRTQGFWMGDRVELVIL